MTSLPLALLKKHYSIQHDALNEISELIALADVGGRTPEELLQKIDDIATAAREYDLLNPHSLGDACAWVDSLEYQEPHCELPPVKIVVHA